MLNVLLSFNAEIWPTRNRASLDIEGRQEEQAISPSVIFYYLFSHKAYTSLKQVPSVGPKFKRSRLVDPIFVIKPTIAFVIENKKKSF